jgi:hypothetical protein
MELLTDTLYEADKNEYKYKSARNTPILLKYFLLNNNSK